MSLFDLEAVKGAALDVLAIYGDRTYNPEGDGICKYVSTDHPWFVGPLGGAKMAEGADESGCFVGEIFAQLGLMTPEIAQFSGDVNALPGVGKTFTPEARTFLYYLQRYQDRGGSWFDAFEYGEDHRKY